MHIQFKPIRWRLTTNSVACFNKIIIKMQITLFLIFLCSLSSKIDSTNAEENGTRSLADYLLDPEIYNRADPPMLDRPTEDRLGIYIHNFDINDADRTFKMSFYLRQSWRDERLKFNREITKDWDVHENIKNGLTQKIQVSANNIKNRIFLPDVFFRYVPSKYII